MSNLHESQLDDLNNWADQYEDAVKRGVFSSAPKPPAPSPQTADHSFFGPVDTDPSEKPAEVDVDYWKALHDATMHVGVGAYVDPFKAAELLKENTGEVKADAGKVAQAIAQSPNPIKPGTVGMDQDVHDPGTLGHTYSAEDVEMLADLKVQLYELENKLITLETQGKSFKGVESKISNMKSRINKLSDGFGHSLPDQMES